MSKKTKAQYKQEMLEVVKSSIEDMKTYMPKKPVILQTTFVQDSVNLKQCHCTECGTDFVSREYSHTECPTCHNNTIYASYMNQSQANIYLVVGDEGEFTAIRYLYQWQYSPRPEDNDPFAWMKDEPTLVLSIDQVMQYTNRFGFLTYKFSGFVSGSDMLGVCEEAKKNTKRHSRFMSKMNQICVNEKVCGVSYQTLLRNAQAKELQKANNIESGKRAPSKQQIYEQARANYQVQPYEKDELTSFLNGVIRKLRSKVGYNSTYVYACLSCGTIFEGPEGTRCPSCGNTYMDNNYTWSTENIRSYIMAYENTTLPENDLLLRIFCISAAIEVKDGNYSVPKKATEVLRCFCSKKSMLCYTPKEGEWQKQSLSKISIPQPSNVLTPKDKIPDIVNNSALNQTGFLEAIGLGDSRYTAISKPESLAYLRAWYVNPGIEKLVKSPMTKIADYAMRNPTMMKKGNTIEEILDVAQPVRKMATTYNLNWPNTSQLYRLWQVDNDITIDVFNEILATEVPIERYIALYKEFGIKYKQAVNYLESAYNHQCIEKMDCASIWFDYLDMAKNVGIDLSDKNRRYPSALKKEHDVAMFAYRAIKQQIDLQTFMEQAKVNTEKYGNFEDDEYVIVVPQTPQEVAEEATNQHNCLRSYMTRIRNGQTAVVFIRRKIDVESSYVTCEVLGGKLTQCNGAFNRSPFASDPHLARFVHEWKKAKNIN